MRVGSALGGVELEMMRRAMDTKPKAEGTQGRERSATRPMESVHLAGFSSVGWMVCCVRRGVRKT